MKYSFDVESCRCWQVLNSALCVAKVPVVLVAVLVKKSGNERTVGPHSDCDEASFSLEAILTLTSCSPSCIVPLRCHFSLACRLP